MTTTQQVLTVAAGVAATMLTRFAPFVLFRPGRPTPRVILYLGRVLPASVFALLVVYCLRHVAGLQVSDTGAWSIALSADATAQMLSVALTFIVHAWRRNLMWSTAAGTLCYMMLVRLL